MFNEAIKGLDAGSVKINNKTYNIVRFHTMDPRGKTNKIPRDASMSKTKYNNLFSSFKPSLNTPDRRQIVVFKTGETISYISFIIEDTKITIITAIIKQRKNTDMDKIINRLSNHDTNPIIHKGSIDSTINEKGFGDVILAYKILKGLGTKWTDTDAFTLGIIDKDGKKLKSPDSKEEKEAYSSYNKIIFNLKRILAKFVGKSNITQSIASLYLLKEGVSQRGVDLICEKLCIVDFKEPNIVDKQYIEALVESYIEEDLPLLYIDGKSLRWNPNKTDEEFQKRILDRTNYTFKEFYEVAQTGLDVAQKTKQFTEKGNTCLYYNRSKFVLIVNKEQRRLITIRDGSWDKPSSGKCKIAMVFESQDDGRDIVNNVLFNGMDFPGYELFITEEELGIGIKDKYESRVDLDL